MRKNQNGEKTPTAAAKTHPFGLKTLTELFDISPKVASAVVGASLVVVTSGVFYFLHSAPPHSITITSGPEGSSFYKNAVKYAKFLEERGVQLNVLPSEGSIENLKRLGAPDSGVDLGMVQAGIYDKPPVDLVSLGSISYQPILLFYRAATLDFLSQLEGKRVSTGPLESGTHKFASALLSANGINENGATKLFHFEAHEAAKKLSAGEIDAAFIMSESASSDIMKQLLHSKEMHLFSFKQAAAYSRKIDYLNVLDLPEGYIDFGQNIPPHDITLVGPMVELVAKKSLHPALSDLILEAATAAHGRPGVFQHRGEFPAAIEHGIPISEDATRFYKSGKSFFYRFLPFGIASLVSRFLVVFLPMAVFLIPILRSIPAFFRWRMQNRIYRKYRDLLVLENKLRNESDITGREHLRELFDRIENTVNHMKVPPAFADQFYGLRGHIDFVRDMFERRAEKPKQSMG